MSDGAKTSNKPGVLSGIIGLVYGISGFIIVHLIFLWFILFLANYWVSPSANISSVNLNPILAGLIDLGLITLFGMQHSLMARDGFKAWNRKFVPVNLERSTYVHAANLVLVIFLWFWQPIPLVLWDISSSMWQVPLWIIFIAGWALSFAGSMMIDHLELLGIPQCWAWYQGRAYERRPFQSHWLYQQVRHPIQLGLIMAFLASPLMTLGHALLAAGLTTYILIAIRFEEQDLSREFGPSYDAYREATPKLIPWRRS